MGTRQITTCDVCGKNMTFRDADLDDHTIGGTLYCKETGRGAVRDGSLLMYVEEHIQPATYGSSAVELPLGSYCSFGCFVSVLTPWFDKIIKLLDRKLNCEEK